MCGHLKQCIEEGYVESVIVIELLHDQQNPKRRSIMKMKKRLMGAAVPTLLSISILIFGMGGGTLALAQEYPTRPIDMIISMAPGASCDIGARLIAKAAEKYLGKEIVPINKAGGGGAVAAGLVAKAKPDGYTILAFTSGTLTNAPHMESVTYKTLEDFVSVFEYGYLISAFIVQAESPYKTIKDVVEAAKKNPGKISFGVPGTGTSPDIAAQMIADREKADIAVVSLGGSAPSITALLGGHITVAGVSTPAAVPQVKGGKVRALATTDSMRADGLPGTATLVEQGYPDIVLLEKYVIAVPKGTPRATIDKLENAFRKAWAEESDYKKTTKSMYMYPENPLYGAKLNDWIKDQYVTNERFIKKANIAK
jgi:tripartite-type tricarboxylate transporter receptor subunit TctC